MSDPPPDSPPPRTTGGNWRWTPPSAEELEVLLPGYSVDKLLGQGGMGAVYKGTQKSLERPVAIKILPSGVEKEDQGYTERFRNEGKVMGRLQHPAIVTVYDFGTARDGQLFFVMEYIDGTDVHQLITSQGRLPPDHAHAIAAHVCDALTAAHALGIIHRDIKPANVLINQQGQVKVADFGLAKIDDAGQRGLTQTGMALGTPDYVAPEALVLGVDADARADLYAVGVMLYQMLTGELPRGAWKRPSEKVPGLDPRFDDVVNRAMQSDPADRYQTSAELRRDLDVITTVPLAKTGGPESAALPQQAVARVAGQRSVAPKVQVRGKSFGPKLSAKPPTSNTPAPAASKGNKGVVWAVGAGAAALIIGGLLFALTRDDPDDDPQASTDPGSSSTSATPAPDPTPAPTPPAVPDTGPATPPATNPEPAPPATETPALTEAAGIADIGAYPEGLKVPIPDWLREASLEGGRLEFVTLEETPAAFDDFFDLGPAAEFDDFVWVGAGTRMWVALRRNGDLWGKFWTPDEVHSVGPVAIRSISHRSIHPFLLGGDGSVFRLESYQTDLAKVGEAPAAGRFVLGYQGRSGNETRSRLVLDQSLGIIDTWTQVEHLQLPPVDFFQGSTVQAAMLKSYLALTPNGELRTWRVNDGQAFPFDPPAAGIVDVAAWGYEGLLLNEDGEVISFHEHGKYLRDRVPADLPPAIRVKQDNLQSAQLADGTWRAWKLTPGSTDAWIDLAPRIAELGPLLDWHGGSVSAEDEDDERYRFLLVIRPKRAPPTNDTTQTSPTPTAPAPPTPTATPTIAATEARLAADRLAEAKARGGKLRAWGRGPHGPFDVGAAADFDDFVQVTGSHFGWAARRANGEVHAASWGNEPSQPYIPLGPYETTYLSRAAFISMIQADGTSRNVWSDSSQHHAAKPVNADRIIAVMNYNIRLAPEGKQNWLYGSPNPPQPDFFSGATSLTGTYDYFISHAPGQPVRSWIPKNGTEFTFPEATRDTVEMDGGHDHVVLLDANGAVQVWNADGTALAPDRPVAKDLPATGGPFVAVRAGRGMSAAQEADATWMAWGDSPELAAEIHKIGPALDLDLYHDGDTAFAMWIEPAADAPDLTRSTTLPDDVAERLAKIEAQFQTAYDRDIAPGHDAAVATLDQNYAAAVERTLATVTRAGDLDGAVALRAEIQRLEGDQPMPDTDAKGLPETLVGLRATYREAFAGLEAARLKKAGPYFDRHDQLLEKYQQELTRQNRLDDAVAVRTIREMLAAERGGEAPEAIDVPEAPVAAPPKPPPVAADTEPKLPSWLEAADEEGGKLRLWGTFDGEPIDEREALKDFRESGYTQVMTGSYGLIFGSQRRGSGKRSFLDQSQDIRKGVAEYREIQALDRSKRVWLAGGYYIRADVRQGIEHDLWDPPVVSGNGDGHLIRLKSGDWVSPGYHYNNPADPSIKTALATICEQLKADDARLVASDLNHVVWLTRDNRLRQFTIALRPGLAKELPVETQPTEPIVELIKAGDGTYGAWIARGASGAVYAERRGGFETPIAEVSPALALRHTAGGGFATLVARKPDGSWQAIGPDEELNKFVAGIGPAIDLDVYAPDAGKKHRVVLWIEPRSGLQN